MLFGVVVATPEASAPGPDGSPRAVSLPAGRVAEHGEVLRHPNAGLAQLHQFDPLLRFFRAEDQAEG